MQQPVVANNNIILNVYYVQNFLKYIWKISWEIPDWNPGVMSFLTYVNFLLQLY